MLSWLRKAGRATEEERILAIQLIESGRKFDDVAEIMGVVLRTVFEWWEKYRNSGLALLSAKFASGRPTALSDRQMLELRALITGLTRVSSVSASRCGPGTWSGS